MLIPANETKEQKVLRQGLIEQLLLTLPPEADEFRRLRRTLCDIATRVPPVMLAKLAYQARELLADELTELIQQPEVETAGA